MEGKRLILAAEKTVGRAVNRWTLIGDKDKVAVGVSGSKDSLAMLELLARRRAHLPISYELYAVHVAFSDIPYKADIGFIETLCSGLNVPFTLIESKASLREGPPCLTCSRKRRSELFNFCRNNGCTKLALGHHRDDLIETLMLNIIFQGSLGTMPPKLDIFNGSLSIIRPLALMSEERIREYAALRSFPPQIEACPYESSTKRVQIKKLIGEIEKLNYAARSSMFQAMGNIKSEYML